MAVLVGFTAAVFTLSGVGIVACTIQRIRHSA